jgi:phytoene synthase
LEQTAEQYCSDLVHKADRDRYISALFAPDAKRRHVFALYAFNIELSRIRDSIKEPGLGEVRLEWWRETIESIYAGVVPDHPVAQALHGAIEEGELTKLGFTNMIEARAFDLYDDPMPSLDALEGYLGETSCSLIQMASLVLAGKPAASAADAAGHAGIAYGIVGLLRMIAIHRSRGQCYLPVDVLARHDVLPAHILAGRMSSAIRIVVREMREVARSHLLTARERLGGVPPAALPAFLHVSLVDIYLKRLEKPPGNLMTTVPEVQQLRRQWHVLKAAIWKDF